MTAGGEPDASITAATAMPGFLCPATPGTRSPGENSWM